MILWLWTNVSVGQSQFVSYERTLSNGTCCHTSHSLSLREVFLNGMTEFEFDKRTDISKTQCLAIVRIDG